jgi:hypothetical protein
MYKERRNTEGQEGGLSRLCERADAPEDDKPEEYEGK